MTDGAIEKDDGKITQTEEQTEQNMVKVKVNDNEFYLDGYLKSNLDELKWDVKKDFDAVIVITGRERHGKSFLGAQVAYYLDPTYNITRCCFTLDDFLQQVKDAKPHTAVVFDEAHAYISSRQALSKMNRMLIKCLAEIGFKNLFLIIILPSFFELDKYVAVHRSTGLLQVYRRGFFACYDYKRKKTLYFYGKKTMSYSTTPNFIGRFTKFFPLDYEAYKKKKMEYVLKDEVKPIETKFKEQRNKLIYTLNKQHNVPIVNIAQMLGMEWSTIKTIIKKQEQPEEPKPIEEKKEEPKEEIEEIYQGEDDGLGD